MAYARYGHLPHQHSSDSFQFLKTPTYVDSPDLSSSASTPRTPAFGRPSSQRSRRSSISRYRGSPPSGPYDRWIYNWWLWEIMCAVFGVGLMVALIVLLYHYNGQPVPNIGNIAGAAITFNAVVAILAGFSKASLVYTVAECLGQLKWIWYSKRFRPMKDLEKFDEASRGSYGAFALIWTVKFRQIATLGGILMIAALVMDPLAQLLVVYRTDNFHTSNDGSWLPAQTTWKEAATDVRTFANPGGLDSISPITKGSVQSGIYQGNYTMPDVVPACSSNTGNCTYPNYKTLAVCQSWTDITEHLVFTNKTASNSGNRAEWYNLSPQHFILNADGTSYFNTSSVALNARLDAAELQKPLDFSLSWAYKDVKHPIADLFVVYYNGTLSAPLKPVYSAMEVVFEWCVQEFHTTFENGNQTTTRLDAVRGFETPNDSDSSNPNVDPQVTVDGTVYSVDATTHYSLQRYFFGLFQARLFVDAKFTLNDPKTWIWYSDTDTIQSMFEPFNVFQQQHASASSGQGTNQTGFDILLHNIATSMTNHIRTTNPTKVIKGQSDQSVVVVSVRWVWIIGPLAFTFLAVFFLVTTIVYQASGLTAKGSWKTSSLAVLHAANPDLQHILQGMKYTSEMVSQAKSTYVRLIDQPEGGWRLFARKPT